MSTALSSPQRRAGDTTAHLSGQQKAAIIVRLLQAEGADISLTALSGHQQTDLVHQMADLSHIDQPTLTSVVEEFLGEFVSSGLSFPTSLADSVTIMEKSISPTISRGIRHQAGLSLHADPWAKITDMEIDELLPLFSTETIEVGAIVLSKLKVATAAEVLGQLPGGRARKLTYGLSLIGDVPPQIVQLIGQTIVEQLDTLTEREFDDGPVDRVGEILNFSAAATREDMLEGLKLADAEFAEEVRKAIFTFANIPERIETRDIPKITREIDPADLVTALVAAKSSYAQAVDFILGNMSQRMADQLREEMDEKGDIKPAVGEAAMTTLVIAIRALADSGEITLIVPDE